MRCVHCPASPMSRCLSQCNSLPRIFIGSSGILNAEYNSRDDSAFASIAPVTFLAPERYHSLVQLGR